MPQFRGTGILPVKEQAALTAGVAVSVLFFAALGWAPEVDGFQLLRVAPAAHVLAATADFGAILSGLAIRAAILVVGHRASTPRMCAGFCIFHICLLCRPVRLARVP